ncbi:MAG: ROK family protein [Acidimicrobiia bacterium]|nr:ROK family protein [Acidimicrobiia bacterium]
MITLGIDVGGTKMLGVALDEEGSVLARSRIPTPESYADLLDEFVEIARSLESEAGAFSGVGVGIAGLVTLDGRVRYAPNLPALREAPLADDLGERLGVRVAVDNDANAAGWGEATAGAARGGTHVLVITLGTGIGGGIVTDGRPYRGANGFAAEIGHFTVDPNGPRCACGESGHWEAMASGTALGRLAREWVGAGRAPSALAEADGDATAVDGRHVTRSAARGADDSLALLAEYADRVAIGLAGLANILDPEKIVIGGGVMTAGAALLEPLQRCVAHRIEAPDYRPAIPVVAAELGEAAGAIGAAVFARASQS